MTRFRTRDQEYENERRSLAPYACFSDEAADTRLHPDGPAAGGREAPEAAAGVDDPRTPYQHDRDRILHSVAFRRLQYKTQVYVFHEGDFYRTRLTHTLEVAQIAKGLAQLLRVNQDLVEAISLAHDVGHPPFGHAGEETLDWLMAGHGGFEHNLQALRVMDELETRYPHFPGLNLTRDTREGIAKHATFFDTPREVPEFAVHPNPSLEAQLSGLADMVAYCTHDIEDALRVRIVRSEEIAREVPLWARALEDQPEVGTYLGRAEGLRAEEVRVRTAVRNLIRLLIRDAAQATAETLERIEARSVDDIRRRAEPVACFSPEVRRDMMRLKEFLMERVYEDPRVLRMTHKGRMIIERLWEAFTSPGDGPGRPGRDLLPRQTQERLAGGEESLERVVCDFIAGMTDRHAMDLYNVLYQAYEPSLHTF